MMMSYYVCSGRALHQKSSSLMKTTDGVGGYSGKAKLISSAQKVKLRLSEKTFLLQVCSGCFDTFTQRSH